MRMIFSVLLFFLFSFSTFAYEKRDFLQRSFDAGSLKNSLILNQEWVTYPDYSDRAGWDALTGGLKREIISRGEEFLDYEWKVVTGTNYLEYERSGDRNAMQQPFNSNRSALSNLVIAELAEGEGRFLDQIANGIWLFCEKTSWVQSAHMGHHTRQERTSLPDYDEYVIDLLAGDVGSFLSWTYYFLKDELDRQVNPLVSQRLRKNLQERILDAYMERDYSYLAFNATPLTKVNNWNPWVNFNVICSYLLLENDPEKLAAAVYRSMISVDSFINYYHEDGATEEGTSYFSHAVGKMYDYLQILNYAGVQVSPVFNEPLIKKMGEFVSTAYIG
ncbi:MAG: heparinase, partial [Bacteroidales bacterium]